jgi:hypothetical protein
MRVEIRCDTDEPSTQKRTKARHDPATLRVMQETLGQESSQHSARQRRGDPPPSYTEGSEEEEKIEEEEGTESDEVEDDTYEQPQSLLTAMEWGPQKRSLATSPIPRRATKPHTPNKAKRLHVHLPSTSKE